jgi:hypothetical protein
LVDGDAESPVVHAPKAKAVESEQKAPAPVVEVPLDWKSFSFAGKNLRPESPLFGKTLGDLFLNTEKEYANDVYDYIRSKFMKRFEDLLCRSTAMNILYPESDMHLYNACIMARKHLDQAHPL